MNTAIAFLSQHWERLRPAQLDSPDQLEAVLLTPRFQASAHVIFIMHERTSGAPVLVLKAARRREGGSLAAEASSLQAVHELRPGGFDSVPRLLALEEYCGTPVLLETAVQGRMLSPAYVRQHTDRSLMAILNWTAELGAASVHVAAAPGDCAAQLERLARTYPLDETEREWVRQSIRTIAAVDDKVPRVFEHGDLSAPNLLLDNAGRLGVVDWELGRKDGLPAQDLFFALAFAASAVERCHSALECAAAFDRAFLVQRWAWRWIDIYASRLELDPALLPSLFVACWSRYVAGFADRLRATTGADVVAGDIWARVRTHRSYAYWRLAVSGVASLEARSIRRVAADADLPTAAGAASAAWPA
jgi:aminoglycoside phosphotransferase